ncbi:MAG: alanine--glyoxylate aminotransferase family protein, partial [cyanobacterium endosymbiont of Rhopalodia fuxianensis]
AIRSTIKKQFDISLAGGQDHLKGKIFRIGHLGFVSERDILTVIAALESTLITLGSQKAAPGVGVAAASKILG